jgi:nitrate/nitrite transporter NarK
MNATHIGMVYVSAVFYGLGLGQRTGSRSPLMARYFGRKGFATIHGIIGIISLPVGFFAPIYIGWVYDVTGSYSSAFSQALALVIVAFFLLFFLNPPKLKQKVKSDIDKFL